MELKNMKKNMKIKNKLKYKKTKKELENSFWRDKALAKVI